MSDDFVDRITWVRCAVCKGSGAKLDKGQMVTCCACSHCGAPGGHHKTERVPHVVRRKTPPN